MKCVCVEKKKNDTETRNQKKNRAAGGSTLTDSERHAAQRSRTQAWGREDDGGRLQTDPVVDFPKHCILLHSFFINIEGVTEKRNPKEVTVFI